MRFRKAHEGKHVGFSLVHQRGQLRELRSQLIGHRAPLLDCGLLRFLREHGVDHRQHDLALSLARVRQGVAYEVHAAALPGCLQYLRRRGFQALVGIGDDKLHPTQATAGERAQEARPERLSLRRPDRHTEHFAHAIGVHGDRDYHRHRDDAPGLADLQVGGVDP